MSHQKLPVRTFIPTHVGNARQNWYKTKKKPKLDKLDANVKAPENFQIIDIAAFLSDVNKLTTGNRDLAVYLGTEAERKPNMVLLFAGIKKWSNLPEQYYILNKKGRMETIAIEKAHALRNNYQNGIQPELFDSTGDGDIETEYIYFENEIIMEILGEIGFQADQGKISGLKIQLVSYADKEAEGGFYPTRKPKYLQRLSVMFTYTKNGRDTSFEEIDFERYKQTREEQEKDKSGLNSGRPVPPPPPRGDIK